MTAARTTITLYIILSTFQRFPLRHNQTYVLYDVVVRHVSVMVPPSLKH